MTLRLAVPAAREVAVDALVHQSGVIRADTIDEMFDVAACLAAQPLPAGRRVAMVGVGLGGIHVEVLGGIRFRIAPLTDRDADELIREVPGFALLEGARGRPPADITALSDVVLRVSRLAEEVPEILELDLNPLIVLAAGTGARIVDARIKVGPTSPRRLRAAA